MKKNTYDHAFLTPHIPLKSPNALGHSLGLANPVATLTTPYPAFSISTDVYVRIMCTHRSSKRRRKGWSVRLTGCFRGTTSNQEPCGVETVYDVKASARRCITSVRRILRMMKRLRVVLGVRMGRGGDKEGLTISNTRAQLPQARS
jgi:hypothetical protein